MVYRSAEKKAAIPADREEMVVFSTGTHRDAASSRKLVFSKRILHFSRTKTAASLSFQSKCTYNERIISCGLFEEHGGE
eukprot:8760926-Pyramimonas_sp.AAC.1